MVVYGVEGGRPNIGLMRREELDHVQEDVGSEKVSSKATDLQ
jgi:hypothetical protein